MFRHSINFHFPSRLRRIISPPQQHVRPRVSPRGRRNAVLRRTATSSLLGRTLYAETYVTPFSRCRARRPWSSSSTSTNTLRAELGRTEASRTYLGSSKYIRTKIGPTRGRTL